MKKSVPLLLLKSKRHLRTASKILILLICLSVIYTLTVNLNQQKKSLKKLAVIVTIDTIIVVAKYDSSFYSAECSTLYSLFREVISAKFGFRLRFVY